MSKQVYTPKGTFSEMRKVNGIKVVLAGDKFGITIFDSMETGKAKFGIEGDVRTPEDLVKAVNINFRVSDTDAKAYLATQEEIVEYSKQGNNPDPSGKFIGFN